MCFISRVKKNILKNRKSLFLWKAKKSKTKAKNKTFTILDKKAKMKNL